MPCPRVQNIHPETIHGELLRPELIIERRCKRIGRLHKAFFELAESRDALAQIIQRRIRRVSEITLLFAPCLTGFVFFSAP